MRATTRSMSAASTTSGGTVGRCRRAPAGVGRRRVEPHDRAGLVDEIDRAVGQPVVAQMPRRQLGGGLERRVGVRHAVVLFVAAAQAGEDLDRLLDRRLVDRDLLQPPRERAILLDVLELLERRRADDAQIAGGEQRLDQRREIHRAAGDRAGADGRVDLVDEEDRLRPRAERLDDRLEALLEVAAEARAGEQRAGVEREDLRALQRAPGRRRRAAASARPSAIAVLPTPASPTNTGLFLRRRHSTSIVRCSSSARPISGSSSPCARALGQVRRSRRTADRAPSAGPSSPSPAAGAGSASVRTAADRRLRDAVRDVLEHVEPRDALLGEQLRGVRLRLLQDRRADVAGLHFLRAARSGRAAPRSAARGGTPPSARARAPRRAAAARSTRRGSASRSRRSSRQVGAAGGEDPLAVGIVRERVEQVLEREVGVPARDRLAVGDGQDDFDGRRKTRVSAHASSIVAAAGSRPRAPATSTRVDLGFGDFPRIDAGDAAAVQVHLHHDPVRLGRRFLEHASRARATTNSIVV